MDHWEVNMDRWRTVEVRSPYMKTWLLSPTSPEKIIEIGQILDLSSDSSVIDFGCGYGEVLRLLSLNFGTKGIGIDAHEFLCKEAVRINKEKGVEHLITIVSGDAGKYDVPDEKFDVAMCLSASFAFGGFRGTIKRLKDYINPMGSIVVAEPCYLDTDIPEELVEYEGKLSTEYELLQMIYQEDLELVYIFHSSNDEWDRYVSSGWHSFYQWVRQSPEDPEAIEAAKGSHRSQEMYIRYRRKYERHVMFILQRSINDLTSG
jgi:SAM-dependent methyltransferase